MTMTMLIHMHSKHSLLQSTTAVTLNWTDLQGDYGYEMCHVVDLNMSVQTHRLYPNISNMEEFGHRLVMNRQTGRGDTSLSHRTRASDHFITRSFSQH